MNSTKCLLVWAVIFLVAPIVLVPAQQTTGKVAPPGAGDRPLVMGTHFIVASTEVKWTVPPLGMERSTPSVDAGGPLRFAFLEGDPLIPGVPFTIRLGCDDGYKAAPHRHPTEENIVVLQGALELGTGDTFNPSGMQEISAGGYGFMPRRMHHFGQCKGTTDIHLYGVGPFQINWISGTGKPAAGNPSAN